MHRVVPWHICLLQNPIAIFLSLTTIFSLLNIPDVEHKGKVVAQSQPDLVTKSKLLQLLVSIAPAYLVLSVMM